MQQLRALNNCTTLRTKNFEKTPPVDQYFECTTFSNQYFESTHIFIIFAMNIN